MRNLLYLCFVMAAIGLFACTKNNSLKEFDSLLMPAPGNEFTIESCSEYPMLSFSSMEEFATFMEQIVDLTEDELDLIPELSGFLSERKFIDELDNKSDEEVNIITNGGELGSAEVELLDPTLSAVLNPKHEIKIAGVIYEINNDYVFAYTDCQHKTDILNFKLNSGTQNIEFDESQFVKLTDNVLIYKTNTTAYGNEDEVVIREEVEDYIDYSGKRRLLGKIFQQNWVVWAAIGVKTANYKKVLGTWYPSKARALDMSWEISFIGSSVSCDVCSWNCDLGGVFKWSDDKQGENTSSITEYFDRSIGIGATVGGDGSIIGVSGGAAIVPVKILRHGAQGHVSKSNHTANTRCCGKLPTLTIKWKPC